MLEGAWTARTTVQADAKWGDDDWRTNYMRVDDATRETLSEAGDSRREDQELSKTDGRTRLS